MLKELEGKYHPKKRGFVNVEENNLIKETLCLAEMDVLALRNLRDFTVAFLCNTEDNTREDWDRMSAITYIIDTVISQKGGEV
jgi:hypothetical protein